MSGEEKRGKRREELVSLLADFFSPAVKAETSSNKTKDTHKQQNQKVEQPKKPFFPCLALCRKVSSASEKSRCILVPFLFDFARPFSRFPFGLVVFPVPVATSCLPFTLPFFLSAEGVLGILGLSKRRGYRSKDKMHRCVGLMMGGSMLFAHGPKAFLCSRSQLNAYYLSMRGCLNPGGRPSALLSRVGGCRCRDPWRPEWAS